ncbi:hypothetical protein GPECTOR_5g336 [Gonium pectorale]|uniref:Uncharacterized protein n=1 Tax=Gonium pectorale TaxID=33097 RepID=A0A150GWH1_GONPE|nr:hypothetical protein GPECTOR_5g336 [Gonium pectorale]|eukprot:KXZ54246.1 hypothetical protein GPECTOR_5g336 [Gonium pectorale]
MYTFVTRNGATNTPSAALARPPGPGWPASRAALTPADLDAVSGAEPPPAWAWQLRFTALRSGLFPELGSFGTLVQTTMEADTGAASRVATPDPRFTGVLGVFKAFMLPPQPGGPSVQWIQFRSIGDSVRLYLQGLMVLNASQTLPLGRDAAVSAPPQLTATSACIQLQDAGRTAASPGGESVYQLEGRFAMGDIGDATSGVLDVQWAPCDAKGDRPTGRWSSLEPLLSSAVAWPLEKSAELKRGAMRCEVYTAGADDAAVPSARDRKPLASATLPDIYPSASTGGFDRYHARCWAFWGGAFRGGLMTMRGAYRDWSDGVALIAATYLGSHMIYKSLPPSDALTRKPLAPLASLPGDFLPLLVLEYLGVAARDSLGLLDGTDTWSQRAFLRLDHHMGVPAWLV